MDGEKSCHPGLTRLTKTVSRCRGGYWWRWVGPRDALSAGFTCSEISLMSTKPGSRRSTSWRERRLSIGKGEKVLMPAGISHLHAWNTGLADGPPPSQRFWSRRTLMPQATCWARVAALNGLAREGRVRNRV